MCGAGSEAISGVIREATCIVELLEKAPKLKKGILEQLVKFYGKQEFIDLYGECFVEMLVDVLLDFWSEYIERRAQ